MCPLLCMVSAGDGANLTKKNSANSGLNAFRNATNTCGALHYNLLQMELEVYHYYNSWSPWTSATGKFRVWKRLM